MSHELYVRRQGIVCHTTEYAGVRKLKKKNRGMFVWGMGTSVSGRVLSLLSLSLSLFLSLSLARARSLSLSLTLFQVGGLVMSQIEEAGSKAEAPCDTAAAEAAESLKLKGVCMCVCVYVCVCVCVCVSVCLSVCLSV